MIEHLFDSVKDSGRLTGPPVPPRDGLKIALPGVKQKPQLRRLTAVKRTPTGLVAVTLRTGIMVGAAVLLILVLLPAAIAAQAAVLR